MYDFKSYYVDGGEKDRSVKQMMDHYYNESYTVNSAYWQQGLIDKRFKAGDQRLYSAIYGENDFQRHKRFFFNKIRKHVNMIYGHQRRNRKSMQAVAVDNSANNLSDQYTKALLWAERRSLFQSQFSKACEGSGDVGIEWMLLNLNYQREPLAGELTWDNVSYNNCLIDPYFRKPDYSDGNFWWRRRWLSKDALKNMLPDHDEKIDSLGATHSKDGRFPVQAELLQYNQQDLLPADEFYYRDRRKVTYIIDEQTGETAEWRGSKDELEAIRQPWMRVKKLEISTVKMALSVNGKTLYDGPNQLGVDCWPMVPVLTYYEPDLPDLSYRLQGVIRDMRDAQYLYNRRKIIELQIMESVANSGYIYNVDSVTDVKAFRQTGQGVLIPMKKGSNIRENIQQIQAPQVPQSMIELSRSLSQDITEISGVTEELLGSASDDASGILSMLRQGAGLTTLQTIFDQWDFAHQACGNLLLESLQKNWSWGKAKQVLQEDPDPRFFDAELSKYEIVVQEGVYTQTQRQMQAQQLMYLRNQLQMPIPDRAIIESLQIQNKDDLINAIEQEQQQQQQAQQAAQQVQAEDAQAKAQATQAKAQADLALAQERQAKAASQSSQMIRDMSAAERDEAQADLALVKQLVELDQLSIESLRRSLELAASIRQESEDKVLPNTIPAGGLDGIRLSGQVPYENQGDAQQVYGEEGRDATPGAGTLFP